MLAVNRGLLCSLPWCRQGKKRTQSLEKHPTVCREPVKYELIYRLVRVSRM